MTADGFFPTCVAPGWFWLATSGLRLHTQTGEECVSSKIKPLLMKSGGGECLVNVSIWLPLFTLLLSDGIAASDTWIFPFPPPTFLSLRFAVRLQPPPKKRRREHR